MASAKIQGECDPRFEKVRVVFEESFSKGEIGAGVAVTLEGRPVVDLWGGHADAERTRAWERDTIVNVYSTTKGMTAICANRLVEEGRLDLDAPVARYWPEFAAAGKAEVPVRYLLCHRSGVAGFDKPIPREKSYDWDYLTSVLAAQEPFWKPGTKHGYHALTFGYLVGEVVRRVDGRSVGRYFREEVAEPLGLDFHIGLDAVHDARCADIVAGEGPALGNVGDRFPAGPEGELPLGARVFRNSPAAGRGEVNTREWRGAEIPAANGHGTARALAKAYGALAVGGTLDGQRVLDPETIERANTTEIEGPDAVLFGMNTRFGLGFMLTQPTIPFGPNPRSFGHPGAGGSVAFADPDARLGFGYVMNQMQSTLAAGSHGFRLIGEVYKALE